MENDCIAFSKASGFWILQCIWYQQFELGIKSLNILGGWKREGSLGRGTAYKNAKSYTKNNKNMIILYQKCKLKITKKHQMK